MIGRVEWNGIFPNDNVKELINRIREHFLDISDTLNK